MMFNFISNMKISTRVMTGYGIVLSFLLIIAIIVVANVNLLLKTSGWVDHTHDVIGKTEKLIALAVDMETGERGFLVTGDDAFLEPYNAAEGQIFKVLDETRTLVNDNPKQVERFTEIETLLQGWISNVTEVEIAERRKVTEGEAIYLNFEEIRSKTIGKEIFDNIRSTLSNIENQIDGSTDKGRRNLVTLNATLLDLVNMETGQRGFLLTGEEPSLQPFNDGKIAFEEHYDELKKNTSINITRLYSLVQDWFDKAVNPEIEARRAMNGVEKVIDDVVATQKEANGKQYMDTIRGYVSDIIAEEQALMEVRQVGAAVAGRNTLFYTIAGTIIALVLGIVISIFLSRSISTPIRKMVAAMDLLGDNDLTASVDIDSTDEIGQMGKAYNIAVERLESVMSTIVTSATQVLNAASEISSSSEQIAAGAEEQQAQMAEVASSIEEMSAMVMQSASNTNQTKENADNAREASMSGSGKVQDTISGIERIIQIVDDASDQIRTLETRSNEIGEVIQVIDDIADQTNLLALNANIEAARAGDAGRGFAVVADEVRKLAERTVSATGEIGDKIKQIQTDVTSSVNAMTSTTEQSKIGQKLAGESGDALQLITESIRAVNSAVAQIASAADQQSTGIEEISRNIESVTTVSRQSASSSQVLASTAETLSNEISNLNQMISNFKIK